MISVFKMLGGGAGVHFEDNIWGECGGGGRILQNFLTTKMLFKSLFFRQIYFLSIKSEKSGLRTTELGHSFFLIEYEGNQLMKLEKPAVQLTKTKWSLFNRSYLLSALLLGYYHHHHCLVKTIIILFRWQYLWICDQLYYATHSQNW